jgi:hypothetical protein
MDSREFTLRAPASITAIVTALIIASVLIPAAGIYAMVVMPDLRIFLLPVIVIQTAFGLFGIIVAIGLLRLFEAARKATILLSKVTIIVFSGVLLLFWAAAFSTHNTVFLMPFLVCGGSLVILLPLVIWWRMVLRRESVRSQFR